MWLFSGMEIRIKMSANGHWNSGLASRNLWRCVVCLIKHKLKCTHAQATQHTLYIEYTLYGVWRCKRIAGECHNIDPLHCAHYGFLHKIFSVILAYFSFGHCWCPSCVFKGGHCAILSSAQPPLLLLWLPIFQLGVAWNKCVNATTPLFSRCLSICA